MEKKVKRSLAVAMLIFFCLSGILTLFCSPKQIAASFVNGIKSGKSEGIVKSIDNGINSVENSINENFIFRNQAINMHGFVQSALQKKVVDDVDPQYTVLKLSNGYLTFLEKGPADYESFYQFMGELDIICKDNNADLIYVNKLDKNTLNKEDYPNFYPYLYKDSTIGCVETLQGMGITVLNLKTNLTQQNIDVFDMFFKTDHHWTPQAGIWASAQIVDSLNEHYGYNFDSSIYSDDNFEVEVYEDAFLGSQGKRVGMFYGGVDDFHIVVPKYPTNYTFSVPESNIYLEGSFEETLLFRDRFLPDDIMNQETTAYQIYMKGNHGALTITNNSSQNEKKALLIMDSYGCVVAPYLCESFSRLDCIDLRSFDGSLEEYIKEATPDVVITMTTYHTAE